ncbi:cytochrome c oxidase assembly factor Coa1 family protein [Myxococcus qinghaiensis]|uniref:cytochrome c oxidase assembly factor Coa1 family protein n=1 Tax=Myxococcus qinghaiensis TaxID=2906758 RepID=UPI0020A805ED|nr:cytochrome c oxidase assembly factor Coa1 family protein [Myxococcus qinghaiensis]MCP3167870.1 cytochrome c oxidase assembly factor 1 family protein [Myxococcus qinghaiensis]
MRTSPTRPASLSKRALQGVLGLLVLAVAFQAYDRVKLRMSGAPRAALERLAACAEARDLLGEPIDAAWWGWSHGYLKVPRVSQVWSATSGRVDWWMPIAGSTGRGVLHFQGEKVNGFWTLEGVLESNGTTVQTRGCSAK